MKLGRKLKCDGQYPICGNCQKRRLACDYAPYPKRRGPGKAPKGQKKLAAMRAKAAAAASASPGSQAGSAAAGSSVSQPAELHPRTSADTLPRYTLLPSSSETHLPPQPRFEHMPVPQVAQPPESHEAAGYPQYYPSYPTSAAHQRMGAGRLESPHLQFPEPTVPPAGHSYGRAYDLNRPRPASGLSQHLQYPPTPTRVPGSGTPEGWSNAPPASTASSTTPGLTARAAAARHEPHAEGSTTQVPQEFYYDDRHPPPPSGPTGAPPGQTPP